MSLDQSSSPTSPYTISLRDTPAMAMAVEHAEKFVHELTEWLPGAMARVCDAAEANGGIARTDALPYLDRGQFSPERVFIVVYEGGPEKGAMQVDVTAPVLNQDPVAPAQGLVAVPAHREAFVRLKRSQAEPQDLGAAYVAVEEWAIANGHAIAGPPREVYYTDFHGAKPDEDVIDIAWPILAT
jgi:effector-binding domain-containing protein